MALVGSARLGVQEDGEAGYDEQRVAARAERYGQHQWWRTCNALNCAPLSAECGSLDSMDVAALATAVVALLVSGGSVYYTRMQGVAARTSASIEIARHHADRLPKFESAVTESGDGDFHWYQLQVTLLGPDPLDEIAVVLPPGGGVRFRPAQLGVGDDPDGLIANSYSGSIGKGDTTTWRIALGLAHPATISFRVRARAGKELPWSVVQTVELPYEVIDSIY